MRKINLQTEPKAQDELIWLALFFIFFIVSLPLMTNYCINGANVSFYLNLLKEGGAENLFFLIPSLFVRAGIQGESVYKLLILLINAATSLIAYACFSGIFTDKIVGLVGSMVYTWMPYRLNNLYSRGDLGEALAMTFLPMLLLGWYRLFTEEDTGTESGKRQWLFLVLGYSLLLQSYLLSFLTAAGFTLLLCLIQWKKTRKKQTLLTLLKTVIGVGVLNAWTAVLMLYRIRMSQFPFGITGNGRIQSRGVYLSNFIQLYFRNGSSHDVAEEGMNQIQPYGLGFVVTFCCLVYLWLLFVGRYRDRDEKKSLLRFTAALTVLGAVFALMSLNCFPWDFLQSLNRLLYGIIVCLYEPTRLIPLASVCLTATVCAVVWQIKRWESTDVSRWFILAVVVIALMTTQYLTGDILRTGVPRGLNGTSFGEEMSEAEYQPENLDLSPLDYAKYEGSRYPAPVVFYGAEAASAAGMGVLAVLTGRKKRVEKV